MDPETAFIALGQETQDDDDTPSKCTTSLFSTSFEQRLGMIGSGVIIALSLLFIVFLVIKIRRQDRQREPSDLSGGSRLAGYGKRGLFDRNLELGAEFPYSRKLFVDILLIIY